MAERIMAWWPGHVMEPNACPASPMPKTFGGISKIYNIQSLENTPNVLIKRMAEDNHDHLHKGPSLRLRLRYLPHNHFASLAPVPED